MMKVLKSMRFLPAAGCWLLLAAGSCLGTATFAAEVEGLYASEVPVKSQSAADRAGALRRALHRVLIKVSGNRHPETRRAAAAVLKKAGKLMRRFQYRKVSLPGADPTAAHLEELRLRAEFEPAAVDRALRDAELPVWGRVRPAVLIWLSVEDEQGRRIVGADDVKRLDLLLAERARNRGIPAIMPLLDLDDQSRIRADEVSAMSWSAVEFASQRYQPDVTVIGRVEKVTPTLWEASWAIYFKDEATPLTWTGNSDLVAVLLEEGVAQMADSVAARFTQSAAGAGVGRLRLTVGGIGGFLDYARVTAYLRGLDGVTVAQLAAAQADQATFELAIRGGRTAFAKLVSLGRVLESTETSGDVSYRLLP